MKNTIKVLAQNLIILTLLILPKVVLADGYGHDPIDTSIISDGLQTSLTYISFGLILFGSVLYTISAVFKAKINN